MNKEEFLQLSAKEMWQLTSENLRSGKWTFNQFTAAVKAWEVEENKRKEEQEAIDVYEEVNKVFGE